MSFDMEMEEYHEDIKQMIANSRMPDWNAPSIRIWHQHDMAQFVGNGEKYGFPIFKADFGWLEYEGRRLTQSKAKALSGTLAGVAGGSLTAALTTMVLFPEPTTSIVGAIGLAIAQLITYGAGSSLFGTASDWIFDNWIEKDKDKNNNWLFPNEVISQDGKNFYSKKNLKEKITVGNSESMSKSKKNTVDPEDIISNYGADAVRIFILSDSPPEKDVQWTEQGIQGSYKFIQKFWT